MIPDYSKIIRCPYCGEKKELLSLCSGNTIGARTWSDAKQIAPMLPKVSPVQKCSHCGKYFLEYKQKGERGKDYSFEKGELSYKEWKEAYLQFTNIEESVTDNNKLDKKDWVNIRLGMIQAFNDCYYRDYDSSDMAPKEEREFIVGIIYDFINSFKWFPRMEPLLKAELYREACEFEQCKKVLDSISYRRLNEYERRIYDGIKTRMDKKDFKVFRILTDDEARAEKEKQKELKEQLWIEEQSKDSRLKVCRNGHCYENTGRCCRWCGDTNVVKRIDEDMEFSSKKFYVGKHGDKWLLTTNPDIDGIDDSLRSITVDFNERYRFYYHLDGRNPHPFYFNEIKFGDGTVVKGEDIVKYCDKIIKGQSEEYVISYVKKQ